MRTIVLPIAAGTANAGSQRGRDIAAAFGANALTRGVGEVIAAALTAGRKERRRFAILDRAGGELDAPNDAGSD
jgi:hypothetical protein